ncbi:MAG: hypothetical protein II336_16960 [Loktanella sp.]|nr:hypothetical protein [Loktanella sp.]
MTPRYLTFITAMLIGGLAGAVAAQDELVLTGGVGPLVLPVNGISATVMQDDGSDAYIALAMDGQSALRLATFTSLSLGDTVTMSLCDHDILHVTVQAQIGSGYVMSAPLQADLAQELADVINHHRSCAD